VDLKGDTIEDCPARKRQANVVHFENRGVTHRCWVEALFTIAALMALTSASIQVW
jgi:hypothetical protein